MILVFRTTFIYGLMVLRLNLFTLVMFVAMVMLFLTLWVQR